MRSICVAPDLATCAECLRELRDPENRRYRYPFINCTACGPRYTIVQSLPYDRDRTTMRGFTLCARCRAEYEDPRDRRFHAEAVACPDCGPGLALWDGTGRVMASGGDALRLAADAVRQGRLIAIKGLGGFQILCDARNDDAVRRLRQRKGRDEKPFALMVPNLSAAEKLCEVTAEEECLLTSSAAPIVLLQRRTGIDVACEVGRGSPMLGIMLPYTPLHHLLLAELGFPIVATSGNRSEERICTDERDALIALSGLADLFLVHDRPISRPVDDSVARVAAGREMVIRRARGYAPLPVTLGESLHLRSPVFAFGAHQKCTIALGMGNQVCLSQHLGDLESAAAQEGHRTAIDDLARLHGVRPIAVAYDLHPDYFSTRQAGAMGLRLIAVQHHYAHVLACLADNGLSGPALGVAWDGTGYGSDGTIWGGEFLLVTGTGFERVAHLRTFLLPGGDRAAREPRRAALGVLHAIFGEAATDHLPPGTFTETECRLLRSALGRRVNAPLTSSAGRLFDAVASLIGLRQVSTFEGQAAMELEWAAGTIETGESYSIALDGAAIDWEPTIRGVLTDASRAVPIPTIAAKFHNTLTEAIVAVARRVGERCVALAGGCFQNVYLLSRTIARLRAEGFEPIWHRQIPPNDGGIALGQMIAATRVLQEESRPCASPSPAGC